MEAKILTPEEEPQWDKFIQTHPLSTIHQLSHWGHFQKIIPSREEYWIIALIKDEKIIGGTMVIRHKLPKGFSWLYCARGPLINFHSQAQRKALLKKLKEIAKEEKSIFVRFDPPLTHKFSLPRFNHIKYGFQPQNTLTLDLTKSQEQLLKEMKQKGRYNIRLAEKKDVKIRKADPKKPEKYALDLNNFYEILLETTSRDKFSPHNIDFYKTMLSSLSENADLYIAEQGADCLAAMIVTHFKDTATYYYGASSNRKRHLMAPYLMQWQAIKDAKRSGYKIYDFMGIAPSNAKKSHPWQGVTAFKRKFGGHSLSYAPPLEHSFRPLLHFCYKIYKKLR